MRTASPRRVLRFDAFTLDLGACSLWRGEAPLPLRPKAFDMLCYLAEHAGRLVTKDELHAAIWPGLTVGDDSLVRCVRDIREALDDRDHRIIKTVPKRGYLFAEHVVATESSPAPVQTLEGSPHQSPGIASHVLDTAGRRLFLLRWRGAALLATASIAAAAGMWSLKASPVTSSAAHYAILGRNILTSERSAKANQEALALFAKALALDPDWAPALLGYASVMIIQVGGEWVPLEERPARLDQAEASIERALAREPTSAYAHQLKGVLLRMRGAPDRATAAFERSLALNPDNAWTYAEFGRTKIELGRAEEALADIERALRLKTSDAAIHVWHCWAGMAALHAGRNEEALEWLLKAHKDRPHYALPVPLLAIAYAENGRDAEGRALIAEHRTRAASFNIQSWRRDYPDQNSGVAKQRQRMADILRRLGVPNEGLQTGARH